MRILYHVREVEDPENKLVSDNRSRPKLVQLVFSYEYFRRALMVARLPSVEAIRTLSAQSVSA